MEPFELKPGDQIGAYKVLSELASGGMGTVYLGEHPFLDRRVAIKIGNRLDGDLQKLFHKEAKILAGLHHPNIVTLHDAGVHEGRTYLVMDMAEGHSLADIAQGRHSVPIIVLLRIMAKIAGALQYVHERSVIHRDVKPSNVVVSPSGEPVLMDFGLSTTASGDTNFADGYVVGTLTYMSPEVARGDNVSVTSRSDIWGFGATLFHLVAGRPPFVCDSISGHLEWATSANPVDLSPLKGKAPEYVVDIIGKCLRKDPGERYHSAGDLQRALEATIDYMEREQEDTEVMTSPKAGQSLLLHVEHQEAELPGAFREYQVGRFVGAGRYGEVYRAKELMSGKDVALKVLKAEWVADADAVVRFRREAAVLSRLAHPNIVRVFNFGRYGRSFFMAMEFLSGPTLGQVMKKRGPMEPTEALPTAIHVLRGIAALHAEGIVHRDLKPENISAAGDRVVIFDFGLARVEGMTSFTMSGVFLGTPAYAAPDQAGGCSPTKASDVYSAGVILYEMLSGKRPHQDSSVHALLHRIATEPPAPITKYRPDLPAPVLAALGRMLEKDAARRPGAGEAADLLEKALAVS